MTKNEAKNGNVKQHFFQRIWLIVLAPCLLLQVAILLQDS